MWHGDERQQLEESRSRFLDLNDEQFNAMMERDFFNDYFPLKSRHFNADEYVLPADTDPEALERLNEYIRSFYDPKFMRDEHTNKGAGYTDLYMAMQHFSDDDVFDLDRNICRKKWEKMFGRENYPQWNCFVNPDSHFVYFQFDRVGEFDERGCRRDFWALEKVKAYLTCREKVSLEGFLDLVRYLADNCQDAFGAKIARNRRIDHLCFWLSVRDFALLEKYAAARADRFVRSMPFVPYIGKIGITLELGVTPGSYNEALSLVLFAYVNSVRSREEMNVRDMFTRLIRMRDPYDRCAFPDRHGSFKQGTGDGGAKILLLESADLLLRNKDPDKKCFMFRAAGMYNKEWVTILRARKWNEVKTDYRSQIRRYRRA